MSSPEVSCLDKTTLGLRQDSRRTVWQEMLMLFAGGVDAAAHELTAVSARLRCLPNN